MRLPVTSFLIKQFEKLIKIIKFLTVQEHSHDHEFYDCLKMSNNETMVKSTKFRSLKFAKSLWRSYIVLCKKTTNTQTH